MSKAYDRIEWLFLRRMMQALGFDEAWIELVMVCITSVEYKVIQDGCEVGPIVPGRGLRQGDPISPYLFIMCVEGLSSLMRKYELGGLIHGCKVARNAPMISHLFFADDSFLFFRADMEECSKIKEVLTIYEKASGQVINFQKSSVSFSRNIDEQKRIDICNFFQVAGKNNHGNYLGLPSLVGKNKKAIFSFIKDKVWKRIQGWKRRMLSKAGKEILLKTVV